MKILITGAHFTPAIAVIEELKERRDIQIVYVGRNATMEGQNVTSVESKILPKLGVKFIPITTGRLHWGFTVFTIPSLLKIPIGFIQALVIVLSEKPAVILSFGGYVAVPIVIMGWLWSVPIIVHEQTLVSGLANKISAFFADKIAVGFVQNSFAKNPKTIFTGNPVRKSILYPKVTTDPVLKKIFQVAKMNRLPVVFITGGNQGSHIINQAVENGLEKLLKISCVIHQVGDSKYRDFERLTSKQSDHYIVRKFIEEDMGTILSHTDLIVSRAGINTLTEVAYAKKPALVIPIPYLYQDEQVNNARFFEKLGFIKILHQSGLGEDRLYKKLAQMLKNLSKLQEKAKRAKLGIGRDGAKRLVMETLLLAKSNL